MERKLLSPTTPCDDHPATKQPSVSLVGEGRSPRNRFLFIDALRGIAALLIVVHHCFLYYIRSDGYTSSDFDFGRKAIQIFLIISGFVITYSLRDTPMNPASVVNFILRRFIRLTPVYWFAIGVTVISGIISLNAGQNDPGMVGKMTFSPLEILINGLYLQGILNTPQISAPSWVLCIEVQFYLFYVGILWALSAVLRKRPEARDIWMSITMLIIGILTCRYLGYSGDKIHWLFPFFTYLAFGSLIYNAISQRISFAFPICFILGFATLTVAKIFFRHTFPFLNTISIMPNTPVFVGTFTGLLILAAGYFRQMEAWSGGPFLQYYGKISYSLYLIHMPSLWIFYYVAKEKLLFFPNTPLKMAVFVLASIATATFFAQIVYTCIEKPTARLATRLKSGQ